MIHRTGFDDLILEATVPMTRDALLALVLRRAGTIATFPDGFGPVAASETSTGLRLRRDGLFRGRGLVVLDADVEDLGATCRLHGRVGWHPRLRMIYLGSLAWMLLFVAWGAYMLWSGGINVTSVIFIALCLPLVLLGTYRRVFAPDVRLQAPADRVFLIDWLQAVIDAPVTVRAGGAAR